MKDHFLDTHLHAFLSKGKADISTNRLAHLQARIMDSVDIAEQTYSVHSAMPIQGRFSLPTNTVMDFMLLVVGIMIGCHIYVFQPPAHKQETITSTEHVLFDMATPWSNLDVYGGKTWTIN